MKRIAILAAIAFSALAATHAEAQSLKSKILADRGSITYGPYLRAELGVFSPNPGDGFWQPPNYPSDPQIDFSTDVESAGYGGLALGFNWQNGFRGEIAFAGFATSGVQADCASASDATPCSTHANISTASVKTRAAMINVYYAPLEARGTHSRFQPFLVAGIGSARNEMSDWTRVNPGATQPSRTFEGDTNTSLAWSLGAGLAYEIERGDRWPMILEATYRYYDLGTATGGATPLPGSGTSSPVAPFQFENRSHVIAVGLRVPLKRY